MLPLIRRSRLLGDNRYNPIALSLDRRRKFTQFDQDPEPTKTVWSLIVADGIMSNGGTVGFKDDLPPSEIEAIRALVIDRARAEAQAQKPQ